MEEHKGSVCPLCLGRGEVTDAQRRAVIDSLLRNSRERAALAWLLVAIMVVGMTWLGVVSWDKESEIREEQVQKFYQEKQP